MNYAAIPAELRERRQWVVWRSIVNDEGRITKPPFQARAPQYGASVTRSETWATFEEAAAALTRDPTLQGLGFVFSDADDYFGIDIDDEAKVAPDDLTTRRQFVQDILANVVTYTETSPSGSGIHLIGRGRLPDKGKRSTRLQVELYGSERYFTMTGHVLTGREGITTQQTFVDRFYQSIGNTQAHSEDAPGDTDAYRRSDLPDEEVVRLASNYHPYFAPRFNAQIDCGPGRWSETFMAVIGTLDRFTGVSAQIERIIMGSPLVLNSPPSAAGETRLDKARRNFGHVLQRVRAGNTHRLKFVEHGRAIFEAMQQAQEERAQIALEALRRADEAIAGQNILDAFPMLTDEHKRLTRPPGLVGEFVEATEQAMHHPFTKYAIPATLSALSGIIARGYKLPGGNGLNVNFILAAPSATGKTQTMDAWSKFIDDANATMGTSLSGPPRQRILMQGTSSIQGIFEDFMACPSLCWMIEECAAQLRSMSEASSPTEIQLRDSYNAIFDASRHDKYFTPPRSVANRKANMTPINNLSISTYWTTTDSKFDVFSSDALDGFLSRVSVIRHKGPAGKLQFDPQHQLNGRLRQVLVVLLSNAKRLDETYEINVPDAGGLITHVSIDGVRDLSRQIHAIVEHIKDAALRGEMPEPYTAISRLPVTALRLSAVMAVLENPYTPAITAEQYLWSFSYLLMNALSLLNDMDRGELGSKASDETLAVVRTMRDLLRKDRQAKGVARTELRRCLIERKPFCAMGSQFRSPSKAISDTLAHMLQEGMLSEIVEPAKGPGRPRQLLSPTDDAIWRSR